MYLENDYVLILVKNMFVKKYKLFFIGNGY